MSKFRLPEHIVPHLNNFGITALPLGYIETYGETTILKALKKAGQNCKISKTEHAYKSKFGLQIDTYYNVEVVA